MKTKLIFLWVFLVWGMCFSSSLSAKVTDTRGIELEAKKRGNEDQRSILPVRAWFDNQTVYVTFADLPVSATIVISGSNGEYVVESYTAPKTVSIVLTPTTSFTSYEITISYGDKEFSGSFSIEK